MNEFSVDTDLGRKIIIGLLVVVTGIMAVYALRVAKIVFMPLFIAFFLVMLVYPIQKWMNRILPGRLRRLRPALGIIVMFLITAIGLVLFVGTVWLGVKMVTEKFPQYSEKFMIYWNKYISWANERGLLTNQNVMQSGDMRKALLTASTAILRYIWSVTAALVMIFFFALLMLLEVWEWRGKFLNALGEERTAAIFETLYTISYKLRYFLFIRTLIGAISGITAGLWLWIVGVDLALLWGVITFLFNYVPYIGSILSTIPPTLVALAQYGIARALLAVGGLIGMDQIMGNYLDPRLEGRALIISPTFVLVSIVFWGWLWGTSGALLAGPITITIIAACSNIRTLKPVAILLSRGKA